MQRKFLLHQFLKNLKITHPILIMSLGVFSSQCVSKDSTPSKDTAAKCIIEDSNKGPQLDATKKWLGKFLDKLCESHDASEGWALFDQGGIAGSGEYGQVIFLSGAVSKVFYVPINGKDMVQIKGTDLKKDEFLSKDKRNTFLDTVKTQSKNLAEHWDDGFDMFEREYVHVEKAGKTLKIAQRVKWRFGRGPCENHCKIEQAFQALVK